MAQQQVATELANVQPYVHGVAKHLVDRLYGPQGPAWGTKLSEIEDIVVALRQMLCEEMLDQALQRQAQAAGQRPAQYRHCPSCQTPLELTDEAEPRILQTRAGETEFCEPQAYCRKCRRSFFPSVQKPGD